MLPHSAPPARIRTQELFARMDAGPSPLVLTGSARTARTLFQHYNQWQHKNGLRAWPTPRILTWDAWLHELWDALVLLGVAEQTLLTEEQERSLWRSILDSSSVPSLHPVNSLLETALQSARVAQSYNLSLNQIQQQAEGIDANSFARWLRLFAADCSRLQLLPSAHLPDAIRTHAHRDRLPWPQEIILVGFDRLTPQQKLFFDDLRTQGPPVTNVWLAPDHPPSDPPILLTTRTKQEEIYAAAFWIRQRLQQNPSARIGVIAPSISTIRPALDRIFRRVLAPASLDLSNASSPLPYEFSLGEPLHTLPQIRTALLFLHWLIAPIAWEQASFLLTAGNLGDASSDLLARIDAEVRTQLHNASGTLSLAWMQRFLQSHPSAANSPFTLALHKATQQARDGNILSRTGEKPPARSHADWRAQAEATLRAIQWPLLQPSSSAEFQLLRRWNSVLDSIESIDAVAAPIPFSTWLDTLQNAAHRTLFTLESHGAPVQILGVAESAGIPFDAIWFLDASASSWPAHGQAQPWIPWPLQKQFALPYADAQADYTHTLHTTHRVVSSCTQVTFSFALESSSEETGPSTGSAPAAVRVSPVLLDVLPNTPITDARKVFPHLDSWMQPTASLSTLEIVSEPPVPLQAASIRGGVRFLQLQAACPFRSFAELRLGSASVQEPEPGVDPRTQGSWIHAALRNFWSQVPSQSHLVQLDISQRKNLLSQCIQAAQTKERAHLPQEDLLLAIESERIAERLLAWLDVEQQRPDFSVVACEESVEQAEIGGVQFRCRIDRIDKVDDGLALLDYKTGYISASACSGDRPDEPQLPAYAVLTQMNDLHSQPLRGVAFASLAAKQPRFLIVQSLSQTFQCTEPRRSKNGTGVVDADTLAATVQTWRSTLENLGSEFRAGMAIVDPKHPRKTCEYCEQKLLCRIQETEIHLQAVTDADDDPEEESKDEAQ